MAATMKFVTLYAGSVERAGMVRAISPTKTKRGAKGGVRPHQSAIEVNDLTQQGRGELANLLEAELARL